MDIHKQRVALVAHDNLKPALLSWAKANRHMLAGCELFATGTTGKLVSDQTGLEVTCFLSGPYGGDQQIGAKISEGLIDILVFFWDPMGLAPHDADVKALLRVATLMNIPVANNQSTADCVLAMLQRVRSGAVPMATSFAKANRKVSRNLWPDSYPLDFASKVRYKLARIGPESLTH